MNKNQKTEKQEEIKISFSDRLLHSNAMQYVIAHKQQVAIFGFALVLVCGLGGYMYYRSSLTKTKDVAEAMRLKEEITEGIIPTTEKNGHTKTYAELTQNLTALAKKNKEIKLLVSGVLAEEALLQNNPQEAAKYLAPLQKELISQGLTPYTSFSDSVILLSEKKPREALQILQKLIDSPNASKYPLLTAYCYLHKVIALRSLNKQAEQKEAIQALRTYISANESPLSPEQKEAFLANIDFNSYSMLDFLEK